MRGDLGSVAVIACATQLSSLPWSHDSDGGFYTSLCEYEPAFGSWTLCAYDLAASQLKIDHFNKLCKQHRSRKDLEFSWNNATEYLGENEVHLYHPVLTDRTKVERMMAVYSPVMQNFDTSLKVSYWAYYYLIFCIALSLFRFPVFLKGRLSRMLGSHHAKTCRLGLIPTAGEAILLLGYFLVHIISLAIGYTWDHDNTYGGKWLQFLRLFGDRAGIICFGQLPIVIFFGARNNRIAKFSTSVVFHKWIARIAIIDALLHTGAFQLRSWLTQNDYSHQDYWRYGVYAMWIGICLIVASLNIIRRNAYEIFLYGHIILTFFFLFYSWKHILTFGSGYWLLLSFIIWIAERILRLSHLQLARASVEIVNTGLIKIYVPRKKSATPGQYAYLYFGVSYLWWQSHPFTFIEDGRNWIFVIQVKQGVTLQLYHWLLTSTNKSLLVGVEGPYGHTAPLDNYENILLIGGGSGVPGPLSYALKYDHEMIVIQRNEHILEAWNDQLKRAKTSIWLTDSKYYGSTSNLSANYGRPDVQTLILSHVRNVSSLAVVCCGPPTLVDSVRNFVCEAMLLHPSKNIDYFEEYQIW